MSLQTSCFLCLDRTTRPDRVVFPVMPEFGATQLLTQNAITFGLYSGRPALTITFWFCPVWPSRRPRPAQSSPLVIVALKQQLTGLFIPRYIPKVPLITGSKTQPDYDVIVVGSGAAGGMSCLLYTSDAA